jgi:hypothetical protein
MIEMHTLCTLSRSRQRARTARIVLPVTLHGTADTPHAESGMRYQHLRGARSAGGIDHQAIEQDVAEHPGETAGVSCECAAEQRYERHLWHRFA